MPDQVTHILLRLGHRRAVRRIIDPVVALPEFLEALHVGGHVPVWRNDNRRRPAHYMIAGDQRAAVGVAKMVGRMAGRRDRRDRIAIDFQFLAVCKHSVRQIVAIECGIGTRADGLQRQRRAADDGPGDALRKRLRGRAVVTVRVGAHDRHDLPAANCFDERIDMLGQIRTGIDDRYFG